MRKLSLTVFTVLLVLLTMSNWAEISLGADKVTDKFLFYVKVAQLYTKDPDRSLSMPLENIAKKQISNTWHAPRAVTRLHEGQDIFAPRGTPVYSATEGYITHIGENALGGQTVSVIGAGGRVYYYAHLDSYAPNIAEGDHVTPETVLGCVGSSGNAKGTPPHLHFGVYASTGAINPLPLLSNRNKAKPVGRNREP